MRNIYHLLESVLEDVKKEGLNKQKNPDIIISQSLLKRVIVLSCGKLIN